MRMKIGDMVVPYQLRYPSGAGYFLTAETEQDPLDLEKPAAAIQDDYWNDLLKRGFGACEETEVSHLAAPVSEYLLAYDYCLIHAVAFRFRNDGWLILGPSGTGKSTQIHTLMRYKPGEISVICGDRPALAFSDAGDIIIHPTPWNGKENWHGAPATPLRGIILLKRSQTDAVWRLDTRQAVLDTYMAMIQSGCEEVVVRQISRLTEKLLKNSELWQLQSHSIEDSAMLFYHQILCREASNEI